MILGDPAKFAIMIEVVREWNLDPSAIELKIWNDLLLFMFDVSSKYWNIVWGFFIALGAFVFCLGVKLLKQSKV